MAHPTSLTSLPVSPALLREKEGMDSLCQVVTIVAIGAICLLVAAASLITGVLSIGEPTISLTVCGISMIGTFIFFSIGLCLMNKINEEDDRELEKWKREMDRRNPTPPLPKTDPSELPAKEVVLSHFNSLPFQELLKKEYFIWEAFEKGYLDCENPAVKKKFVEYLKTVSLAEYFYSHSKTYSPLLIPEAHRDSVQNLLAQFLELWEERYNREITKIYQERKERQANLQAEKNEKMHTFREKAADLQKQITIHSKAFFPSTAVIQKLEEDKQNAVLQMETVKAACDIKSNEYLKDFSDKRAKLKEEFKVLCAPLEEEWKAVFRGS